MPSSQQPLILMPISLDELDGRIRSALADWFSNQSATYDHEELMTPKQVEDMLDISHQTRIDWTRQRLLRAYTLGGRRKYYKRSEILSSLIQTH